ncbi:TPA: peptidoglycan DD-metalloendopeptidase family protein [Candidatus Dojkabacteria bacterium]|uniref:Peptidoglycan DD-metalloendopeptidase family protein n=1 Tax=Candidatus Dojkabacteria bacterium TaxID=2099670 RepID=A0A832R9Z6_9BACT|nr:peptidoglycan DD-metalloendopeptidase family protein [Candidatus Dojkabacteria bacterium]
MKDTEDLPNNQSRTIKPLSFRNIKKVESSNNYLFVDDEIEENRFFRNLKNKYREFYNKQQSKNNIIEFVLALVEYIFSRIKVLFVLISVLFDIIFEAFNVRKNTWATKMFWGRGSFLASAFKVLLVGIFFIVSITYLYRKPVVQASTDEQLDSIGVAQTDTLVMNSTINTVIPKDRPRRYTEEYIVKRGDTVASIAQMYNLSVKTILWANEMRNANMLKLGQTLVIPPSDGVIVTVRKGDTVESLAKKYSAHPGDIVDHNWLESPFTLPVGTELFIPSGSVPTPPKPVVASAPISLKQSSIAYKSVPVDPNVGKFLGWPVGGPSKISRGFYPGHYGIDIYPTGGQPNVVASASGTVISAGWGSGRYAGFGYYVHVDHGNGYTTLYAHMQQLYVGTGATVGKGQALGKIGQTGYAFGVHVHFELRRGAELSGRINPAPYMQ